eukprot:365221-Chlamydomonas_euryale.AAC.1
METAGRKCSELENAPLRRRLYMRHCAAGCTCATAPPAVHAPLRRRLYMRLAFTGDALPTASAAAHGSPCKCG